MLAAAPYPIFDLDRFFAPKELALSAFALALSLPLLRRAKSLSLDRTDLVLALYLLLSAAGALLAPDHWAAARALAVSVSGAAVFWSLRASDDATRRSAVVAAAAAAVLAAAACAAQAYGVRSALFSPHRAPGGTLGNRNFVAHLAAVFAPALVLAVLKTRRRRSAAAGIAGAAALAAALVLTRSRAGLLGFAAGAAVLLYGFRRSRGALRAPETAFRLRALLAAAALGALAALVLPNTLVWKSETPYLDTIAGLADYRGGSGRGRVVQYERSLRIAAAHPLLGAGAGNWGVVYPKYVREFDRSIDYTTGRTSNPWPSSDWIAVLSERGLSGLAALLAVFAFLIAGARRMIAADGDAVLEGWALAAILASAAVVGCFDAFLLLPAPAFLLWGLAGALAAASPPLWSAELSPLVSRRLTLSAALVLGAFALRSSAQIFGMSVYNKARTRAQVARAAFFDPGDARIRARLEALRRPAPAAPAVAPLPAPPAISSDTTDDTPEQPDAPPGD